MIKNILYKTMLTLYIIAFKYHATSNIYQMAYRFIRLTRIIQILMGTRNTKTFDKNVQFKRIKKYILYKSGLAYGCQRQASTMRLSPHTSEAFLYGMTLGSNRYHN